MQIVSCLCQLYLQKRILFLLTRYALVPAQMFCPPPPALAQLAHKSYELLR